jgi:hypothetical protein
MYILLLWLSIVVINPFDFAVIDSSKVPSSSAVLFLAAIRDIFSGYFTILMRS